MEVSIEGLDPAAVLAALYNAARPLGMGFMHYDSTPMDIEEARDALSQSTRIDYLKGRPLKVTVEGDSIETGLYDRDQGAGAGEAAVAALRETGDVANDAITQAHDDGMGAAVAKVKEQMHAPPVPPRNDGVAHVVTLGLDDVAGPLQEALDKRGL